MEQPQLGRYVIESEIGRGAMGVVYKATDSVLQRTVAVKTVNMALEREHADKYEARFYQEARAAGGLNHPNIVTVYDAGKAGDVVYMAMEYIQGVELRTLFTEGQPMGGDARRCRSPRRSPRAWPTRTSTASCTATSSRPTSWWWPTGR